MLQTVTINVRELGIEALEFALELGSHLKRWHVMYEHPLYKHCAYLCLFASDSNVAVCQRRSVSSTTRHIRQPTAG